MTGVAVQNWKKTASDGNNIPVMPLVMNMPLCSKSLAAGEYLLSREWPGLMNA